MDIIYSWNFNPLESYPTASGQTDVVFNVHWCLTATTESYNAATVGTQLVQYTSESVFIPFNELTPEIVYGWVSSSMSEETYNSLTASLVQQIEREINPPVIIQTSPWLVVPSQPGPEPTPDIPTSPSPSESAP